MDAWSHPYRWTYLALLCTIYVLRYPFRNKLVFSCKCNFCIRENDVCMDDKAYHVFKGLKKDIKQFFITLGCPFVQLSRLFENVYFPLMLCSWLITHCQETISRPQTRYELELRVLKSTEITYRYVLMRNRISKLRKFS